MKIKWIGLILLSCGLMVGCEEADGNGELTDEYVESAFDELNEKHSTKLPQSVKDGTVSEDVYKETVRYLTDFQLHEREMLSYQDKLNKDTSLWNDDSFLEDYKASIDDYDVFVKGIHLKPSTEADIELNKNLTDTLLYTSFFTSALRQYVDTKDKVHVNSVKDNMNKINTSYTALTNTVKKYKLDNE